MPRVTIIYPRYYDFDANRVVSGGVQTYLTNLFPLFREYGYQCIIFQCDKERRSITINQCDVIAVPDSVTGDQYNIKALLAEAWKNFDNNEDILLFADHWITIKNNAKYSIAIQHGIHWDIPQERSRKMARMLLSKMRFSYQELQRIHFVKQVVCVDYNFMNWYRTQVDKPECKYIAIPNFTEIAPALVKDNPEVKIIFARRFVQHRGTRTFANAICRILNEYKNVRVLVAGRGPDEQYLRSKFAPFGDAVSFTQYASNESLQIHSDQDIALVPTVGSEGTSLSLLEAMSAQCAVICTDVGGMTNIIIDGYNGLMIPAGNADKLYDAIKKLIDEPETRKQLAEKGYDTVRYGFSYERWAEKWRAVIKNIKN